MTFVRRHLECKEIWRGIKEFKLKRSFSNTRFVIIHFAIAKTNSTNDGWMDLKLLLS